MARTQALMDTLLGPDGLPVAGAVTFQLVSSADLLTYQVGGDSATGELIDLEPVTVALADDGGLTVGLIAPGDLRDVQSGDVPASCYYLVILPSGDRVKTTAFAHSGAPVSLADIDAATPAPSYPTAPVTLQVVRPDDSGTAITIAAYLSVDGAIAGAVIRAGDRFSDVADSGGNATLLLPPNDQITPANTFYWVDFGSGARYAIRVPTAGGSFMTLRVAPFPQGTLAPAMIGVGILAIRPVLALDGEAYFATDNTTLYIWAAGAWHTVAGGGGGGGGTIPPGWTLLVSGTGAAVTTGSGQPIYAP